MKRILWIATGSLAVCVLAFGQSDEAAINKALMAAPARMKDGVTVIRWKSDFTYDTLKKGTNPLVCYDLSGKPTHPPFMVECTSKANLPRVAQNLKFEAIPDKAARQAAFAKAEKDGTRVKPEFGSVWIHLMGKDAEHTRKHTTIAVPDATSQSLGLPDNPRKGGVWIMNAGTTTAHLMTPGS
jgi:hypothetical protein